MSRPLHRLVPVSLACALVASSACGGTGADKPELDAASAAAVAQIEAACETWNEIVDTRGKFPVRAFDAERPSAHDLPAVGDYFAADHPARDEMIAAIAAIAMPAALSEAHAALVDALERGQAVAKEQVVAARAADVDSFTATLDRADASQQEIEGAADALGARACRS